MNRPARTAPSTPAAPAARTGTVTTTALAASTVTRRGDAARLTRIRPVPYSPLIASTPTMATTAWLRYIPVRVVRAGSSWQAASGQLAAVSARTPAAVVSAAAASSSQAGPGTVRSLVHSA